MNTNPAQKPYDDLAISRAIAAVSDPALQSFLEAVVDVVTGVSGAQQLRNVEQREALAKDIAEERKQVYDALRDVRYQYKQLNEAREADTNDRKQIAAFLEHEGKKTDELLGLAKETSQRVGKLETGQENLRTTVGALAGEVSNHGERLDTVEGRMGTFEGRLERVEGGLERVEGKVDDAIVRLIALEESNRKFIDMFPPPAEVQERMDADRDA